MIYHTKDWKVAMPNNIIEAYHYMVDDIIPEWWLNSNIPINDDNSIDFPTDDWSSTYPSIHVVPGDYLIILRGGNAPIIPIKKDAFEKLYSPFETKEELENLVGNYLEHYVYCKV